MDPKKYHVRVFAIKDSSSTLILRIVNYQLEVAIATPKTARH